MRGYIDGADLLALQVLGALFAIGALLVLLWLAVVLVRGCLLRARAELLRLALHAREELALLQSARDSCASVLAMTAAVEDPKDDVDRAVRERWLRRCGMLTKLGIAKREEAENFERSASLLGRLLGDWSGD